MFTKSRIFIYALLLIGSVFFSGCEVSDSNTSGKTSGDSIKIISVNPSSGLTDNTLTTFTVSVSYALKSSSQGVLSIGFNNGSDIDSYTMKPSADYIVSEGAGTHEFVVQATAKDWGSQGDFEVQVTISEYPHGNPWSPLSWEYKALSF